MKNHKVNYADKIIEIRKAERLTQREFCCLTGISARSLKMYECGRQSAGASVMEKVMHVKSFEKYTLWLLHGNPIPAAGQIDPALSLSGFSGSVVWRHPVATEWGQGVQFSRSALKTG